MRIGIEAQRIFREKKHGMDIYAIELIRNLQLLDQENEYFIFVNDGPDVCISETSNFHIVKLKGWLYVDIEQYYLPKAVSEYDLDLLHCTSNTAPLLQSVPLITTVHDIIYLNRQFGGGSMYQRLGHYYRKWVVPHVIRQSERVITVSQYEENTIKNSFPRERNKIESIYNGVSDKFKPIEQIEDFFEINEKLALPDKYIFFLGNNAPKKNMKRMLEAYYQYVKSTIGPIKLVIAESSWEDIYSFMRREKVSQIKDLIHLTGYIPNDWLPAVYAKASLFVYPSLRESFGIPIIEAMACKTPVITSNTTSMPEIAGDAAILIDPENTNDIARSIEAVILNESLQKELITKGSERINTFSWLNTAYKTLENYKGVFETVAA